MAKKQKKEEEFWEESDEEDETPEEEEPLEEIDVSKLKFTKIKDLKIGMEDVNVEATIDFVGETYGKGFGQDPYAIGFLKDSTGEIKISFWGDDIKKAKPKKKVRIINASVSSFRDQLQLNPNRRRGVEFL
jgi:ssDNA-binding replication factor A large subunit